MKSKQQVSEALKGEALKELISLGLDHLIEQPISTLVEPSFVVEQVVSTMTVMAEGEQSEQWFVEQLEALSLPAGAPREQIPTEVLNPLQKLIVRPIAIEQELTRNLLSHRAMENMFHAVISHAIKGFTDKLKSMTASAPSQVSKGFGALRGLRDKAMKQTPLGSIASILEDQAQKLIAEHVERTIYSTLTLAADHISAPENRFEQAQFRLHLMNQLLDADNSTYQRVVDDFGREQLVATGMSIVRALLQRDDLQSLLHKSVEQALGVLGEKSVKELMEESGLDHDWRSDTEDQLFRVGQGMVASEPFQDWLGRLLG